MSRRTVGIRNLSKEEFLKVLQTLSENDSGSDENSNLSEDEYIPDNESEATSVDGSSENEENVLINIDSCQASTSCGRNRKRKRKVQKKSKLLKDKGEEQSAFSQNEENERNEEIAKDGTVWSVVSDTLSSGRRQQHHVLREVPGPSSFAIRNITAGNFTSAWRLFINEKILRFIKLCTEAEAHRRLQNSNWNISLEELDAFISLLYARGAFISKGISINDLWSKTWGLNFFHQTMARDRFKEIMRYLRFDLKETRSERLRTDQFALVSEIWNTFIENCLLCYKPGENITVDEQLFPSKARCPFTQYMPQKPDKFGIKFWLATDVRSKYLLNGFPYLGKNENRPIDETVGEHAVRRLAEPFHNTGRNITTDNFFTSLKLAKTLRNKGLSIVGTVKRAKKEVPESFKLTKGELYSSKIVKHDNISLTSYQGKKNKNVLLLSTLHPTLEIGSNDKKTPEVVNFYNTTKYGVDVLDQMSRKYSTKSASRRWPVQVFFNILDFAAINAWVVYKEATRINIQRRDFILNLADELRTNYVSSKTSPLSDFAPCTDYASNISNKKRKQCQINRCRNKTISICSECKKSVCGSCTNKVIKLSVCTDCKKE